MPVRTFDRVDDNITLALGSLGFAFGPGTIAAIVRRAADSSATETVFKAGVSSVGAQYGIHITSANRIQLQCGSTGLGVVGLNLATAEGWCLIAATKATGTVAPRIHKYVFSTATWTHTDSASTVANSGTPTTSARIGATHTPGAFFGGDIGILGVSNTVLNDAAIEALITGEAAWDSAGFVAKWMLDQASTATAVDDDIGAAEQTAITGTSVTVTNIPWVAGTTHSGSGNVSGASGLAGGSGITKPGAGNVAGASSIAGSTGITKSGSGAVVGASGLAGRSVRTSVGKGSFSGTSSLTGSGGSTLTSGRSVLASGSLSGSSGSTVVGEGDFDGSSDLDGTGALILLGSGGLTSTGTVVGAGIVLIVVAGGGAISATGSLAGESSAIVGGAGSVQAASTLAGAATVTYVVGGSLSAVGEMVGAGTTGVRLTAMKHGTISDVTEGYISNVRTGGIS